MFVALGEIERAERQQMSGTAFEFASASVTALSGLKKLKYRFSNNQKLNRKRQSGLLLVLGPDSGEVLQAQQTTQLNFPACCFFERVVVHLH
jgi:hypothetical protein